MDRLGISVIICTYNGEKQLEKTFEYLFKQKIKENIDWEIIVVNNNSTDNTAKTIETIINNNKTHNIQSFYEQLPGKLAALKLGIRNSKFKYLLICDDDNWLDENYIETAYNFMENRPEVGVLGGKGSPVDLDALPKWILPHLHNYAAAEQWPFSADITHEIGSVYGAGMVIRTKIYKKIIDEEWPLLLSALRHGKMLLSGEDTEICYIARLLGYKIYYNADLTFKHNFPLSKINQTYLLRLVYFFGFGEAIISPYLEIENNERKKTYLTKLLLAFFRLLRYDLINFLRHPHFVNRKNLNRRWGYIVGLATNRKRIKELSTYLQKRLQFESSPSNFQ